MKMRTRKAPARTARGTVHQSDISSAQYIAYQSATYGTNVLLSCQSALVIDEL
jgi:hypothetical protein